MFIQASTVPGLAPAFAAPPPLSSPDSVSARAWVKRTAAHLDALHAAAPAPDIAGRRFAARAGSEIRKNTSSIPFDYSAPEVKFFNASFDCPQQGYVPGFAGAVDVGLNGKVEGAVSFGYVVAGSPLRPQDFEFALTAAFNTSIDATLSLDASLTVSACPWLAVWHR